MKHNLLTEIIRPLMSWFDGNARELPWRSNPKAYYVWVSEIMLQQTRVEAVKPYFARFISALPDIESLADCEEERLLKLWEGLGYYNRVRNMQKAAQMIVADYQGKMPSTKEELLKLPGIGSYTAGAIASIAYGQSVPAVDGNVLRVLSRICGSSLDIAKESTKRWFETQLQETMPLQQPGIYNQALMELGALVCVPNGAPDCGNCPVKHLCTAYREHLQAQLPVKSKLKKSRVEKRTVLIIRDGILAAIRKRPAKGLLAGLYELPNLEGHLTKEEVLAYISSLQLSAIRITPLADAKHIFSHVEWQMKGYMVLVEDLSEVSAAPQLPDMIFIEPERTQEQYPIPAAFAAYTRYLSIYLGQEKYERIEGTV